VVLNGNIKMKIKYTLKYGQKGLFLRIWSGKNFTNKDDIMVSKDYPKIFEFLGLDYNRWIEGFDTLEEIFAYTMTSYLFNPEMFQLHKLNKINRERNLKRASYMAFLEFIKNKAAHPDYSKSMVESRKEDVINVIRSYFPEANIDLHLAEIAYKHARKNLIKQKFNGGILMEKYDFKGKEIGESIKYFKAQIFDNYRMNFDDFIIKYDQNFILKNFEYYNKINEFSK
jgi:hypothetical protein